jgi:hypothetical protein
MDKSLKEVTRAFQEADDAWSRELEVVYGRKAGDARYNPRGLVADFSHRIDERAFAFQDSWEWDCKNYTLRFIWCCYAIAGTIQAYDSLHKEVIAA